MHTITAATGGRQRTLPAGNVLVAGGPALEQLKRSAGACCAAKHAQHDEGGMRHAAVPRGCFCSLGRVFFDVRPAEHDEYVAMMRT